MQASHLSIIFAFTFPFLAALIGTFTRPATADRPKHKIIAHEVGSAKASHRKHGHHIADVMPTQVISPQELGSAHSLHDSALGQATPSSLNQSSSGECEDSMDQGCRCVSHPSDWQCNQPGCLWLPSVQYCSFSCYKMTSPGACSRGAPAAAIADPSPWAEKDCEWDSNSSSCKIKDDLCTETRVEISSLGNQPDHLKHFKLCECYTQEECTKASSGTVSDQRYGWRDRNQTVCGECEWVAGAGTDGRCLPKATTPKTCTVKDQ